MHPPLAVATALEGAGVVAGALAAATALVSADRRRRAIAMLAALALAALTLAAGLAGEAADALEGRATLAAAAGGAGLIAVGALTVLLGRRPQALPVLVVATLPFRVPIPVGDDTANLLVPLYAVIAAGCLAYALRWLHARDEPAPGRGDAALRWVRIALAVVLVTYAVQALYSSDLGQAVKNACFFYVPFSVLFLLLLEVRWTPGQLRAVLGITVGLALLFAAVGYGQFATGRLLLVNEKLAEANELKSYFRVNSLFYDPNIYGRFLTLAMLALATVLVWTRDGRRVAAIAAALAVLWGALVLSLSQSSFAALLAGLAVVAALRWAPRLVAGGSVAVVTVAVALVIATPGAFGFGDSWKAVDRATSGRADLVRGGLRIFADRPVLGFGSGSFGDRYRRRERVFSPRIAVQSHTIPVTVAAEQGAVGLAGYAGLVVAAFVLVLGGVRRRARGGPRVVGIAGVAVAAAFSAFFAHTLVYAAFLEDPLAWTLLALAAGLRAAGAEAPDTPDAPPAQAVAA